MTSSSAFGFRYAHENPFSYEFACGVCSHVASESDLDSMMVCEGGCKRIFHLSCVGLSALPDGAASKWACTRCVQRLRACHICDGVEPIKSTTSMLRCSVSHCGKFFHPECAQQRYGDMTTERGAVVCPLHTCGVKGCGGGPISDECYFCIYCLKAYHLKCMPEEVEIICENTCVCLDHQFAIQSGELRGVSSIEDRLNAVKIGRVVSGSGVGAKRGKKKVLPIGASETSTASSPSDMTNDDVAAPESLVTAEATPSPPSGLPEEISVPAAIPAVHWPTSMESEEVHAFLSSTFSRPFRVSKNVSDSLIVLSDDDELVATTKPKEGPVDKSGLDFARLRTNEWICPRPRRQSDDGFEAVCGCANGVCDDNCPNKVCFIQCDGANCSLTNAIKRGTADDGNKADWKQFQCGNKPFLKSSSAKHSSGAYKVVSAGGKGMGIVAKRTIAPGEFILEYIGEVLTVDDWADRQKSEPPGSCKHFYVMDLDGEHVVDASRKGNDSRLINHSCDPNLETQKWTVAGEQRIGLFAITEIAANTELTFNYKFETFASKPFKCLCGTSKCSGWIGGRQKKPVVEKSAPQADKGKRGAKKGAEDLSQFVSPIAALASLASVDIPIASVRSDGTRKKEEEVSLEEISACKLKIDYFLQYVWAGSVSGERWVASGRECATLNPEASGQSFNPAALFALSVTKIEAAFIKERNLMLIRQLGKARRDMARRFWVWEENLPAIMSVLESSWISDDTCTRCRRTGNLVWCSRCVRSFHQCCVGYGDSTKAVDGKPNFFCRRCVKLGGKDAVPPIRLAKKSERVKYWKSRRNWYWQSTLESLLAGDGPKKRRSRK